MIIFETTVYKIIFIKLFLYALKVCDKFKMNCLFCLTQSNEAISEGRTDIVINSVSNNTIEVCKRS